MQLKKTVKRPQTRQEDKNPLQTEQSTGKIQHQICYHPGRPRQQPKTTKTLKMKEGSGISGKSMS